MDINFETNYTQFNNDYLDVIRAYAPQINYLKEADDKITLNLSVTDNSLDISIFSTFKKTAVFNYSIIGGEIERKRLAKRYSKRELYQYLSEYLQIKLPYGSLTGIRPTKLYYDLLREGLDADKMLEFFGVSVEKQSIIKQIIDTQKGIYGEELDKYDYFVNIPFCPTRCAYCSFISEIISKVSGRLEEYTECLLRDIKAVDMPNIRRAVYVGGGTPTSLPYYLLDKILKSININNEEFTVEAGRPDTLSEDIVNVMASNGVNRISINPQTFKESTLPKLGRAHTIKDIYDAYTRASKAEFSINMDLITMLPDETLEDFIDSITKTIELDPDNITIHSLSIKRGSNFNLLGYDNNNSELANAMSDYANYTLSKAGYVPYYMYRQKNTSGRLENIGYTKRGKACVYNIDIMEETHTVYASGAGAISKRVFGNSRIERFAEVKDAKGYIERIDEIIDKKRIFFS